jgi:hypothetical protein
MPNITVSVDFRTYREARVWAAQNDTTVTALVRRFLESHIQYERQRLRDSEGPVPPHNSQ